MYGKWKKMGVLLSEWVFTNKQGEEEARVIHVAME